MSDPVLKTTTKTAQIKLTGSTSVMSEPVLKTNQPAQIKPTGRIIPPPPPPYANFPNLKAGKWMFAELHQELELEAEATAGKTRTGSVQMRGWRWNRIPINWKHLFTFLTPPAHTRPTGGTRISPETCTSLPAACVHELWMRGRQGVRAEKGGGGGGRLIYRLLY